MSKDDPKPSGADDLIDALHELGRCGCKNCHVNPNITVTKGIGNFYTVGFAMPDKRYTASGDGLDQACRAAAIKVQQQTGVAT